jgi:acetyl esterase
VLLVGHSWPSDKANRSFLMSTGIASRIVLDPAARAFLDALAAANGPPIFTLSPGEARGVLDRLQSGDTTMAPAEVEPHTIPGGSSGEISITVVRPAESNASLAAVMYFHGGGWVLGNFGTHERLVRDLAAGTKAAIIFVNYTLSPEAHFPVSIEEAYSATAWVAQRGAELGLDGTRLAVAGDSVGGNMAAAVTLLANERGGPAIRYQVLFYPVTNATFDTGSYGEFADGYWLTREAMRWFWDTYAPDQSVRCEAIASPLLASRERLAGLPPALVITGRADVLRDEGEAYGRRLREAGVDVTAICYEGIIHDFVMLNAVAGTDAARDAIAQASRVLRNALGT